MPTEFLPHHVRVTSEGASPSRFILMLHGILGSGSNFRTLARRLAAARPDLGFVLVDQRMHGQSQNAPPPHTLATTAEDLLRLEAHLGDVSGVLGHSFGAKVALTFAAQRRARGQAPLGRLWLVDASPGTRPAEARPTEAEAVVMMLEGIEQPFPSRERFIEIVTSRGHAADFAKWLAMNARRADDGFRLNIDLPAVREQVDDYYDTDLWASLEAGLAERIDVIMGGRSTAFTDAEKEQLARVEQRAPVFAHTLPNAAHWVHVDDPEGLLAIVSGTLPN